LHLVSAPVILTDPSDVRLGDYVGLRDPELRRRVEAEQGFFIAESPLVVRRLLETGRSVRSVLVTPLQYEALADVLSACDAPVLVAAPDVLRSVVGFDLHRGAVAAADRWTLPSVDEVLARARRVAVLERVNDHENLGVLFRSAAALGIDAVVLDRETCDPLYRRCVRVSIGHVLTLPWTRIASLEELRARQFEIVALTPRADAQPVDTLPWSNWPRCALLLGAEGPGLSDAWLDAADVHARIPMAEGADSLNVATAAAIAFYASRLS
jgi:tRNA G18 (ribose-2'-O)-methylase SpoU